MAEPAPHLAPRPRQSERALPAVRLRFARVGMAQSGEGNGCEHGKRSPAREDCLVSFISRACHCVI